uniref:Uncharacterized protein n=1 Tax=Scytodes thoracica TaxID=1112478 RepID=A0A0A0VCK7_SCYTH|nr:hypothetical protein [Scytodes thoracica]
MCMKNSESWYHCYPNKTLEFQGQVLSDNSTVDSDLCSAKNQAAQFQTQAQFNSTRFQQEFQAGMQEFFQQMARLRNELRNLGGMFPAHFPFFPRDEPDSSASGSNETESDEGGWENAFK